MIEYLSGLTPEELPDEQRKIAELIGIEAYVKLVEAYGGMTIYIVKPDSFFRSARNEKIRQEYTGYNYRQLAAKYKLTEAAIRMIVAELDKEMKERPVDGQVAIF